MKDFKLIRHVAKLTGAKPKKSKNSLYTYFMYGENTLMTVYILFEKGNSKYAYFDLTDVYNDFGRGMYSSYEKFLDVFTAKYGFFYKDNVGDNLYAAINVKEFKPDNAISPALSSITVMVSCLNELLGQNCENFGESEWRDCYSLYLNSQRKLSMIAGIGSVAAVVLGGVLMGVSNGEGGLTALGILLIPVGIVAAVVCFIRYKVYKKMLQNSLSKR